MPNSGLVGVFSICQFRSSWLAHIDSKIHIKFALPEEPKIFVNRDTSSVLKPLLYPITIWTQVLERFCSQYCVDSRMDDRGSSVPYFRVLTGSSSGVGGRSRFSRPVQTVKEREVKAHRVTVPLA